MENLRNIQEQLKTLDYDGWKKITDKLPAPVMAYVFATHGSRDQIKQLILDYRGLSEFSELAKQQGSPEVIMPKYKSRLEALIKALKKAHKAHYIPKNATK